MPLSLIRYDRVCRNRIRRRDILRPVFLRIVEASIALLASAFLLAFLDRHAPETRITQLVLVIVTGIVVTTILARSDEP